MTVGELIEKLHNYDANLLVVDFSSMPVEDVRLLAECPLGDPANPKCKYSPAVMIE